MSEPVARMRKLNQFSQFRRTSNNHNNTYRKDLSWLISTCQGLKRGNKWRTNSSIYPFL